MAAILCRPHCVNSWPQLGAVRYHVPMERLLLNSLQPDFATATLTLQMGWSEINSVVYTRRNIMGYQSWYVLIIHHQNWLLQTFYCTSSAISLENNQLGRQGNSSSCSNHHIISWSLLCHCNISPGVKHCRNIQPPTTPHPTHVQ